MSTFSVEKFLKMPIKRQHKHAARLLKKSFEKDTSMNDYLKVTKKMCLPPLNTKEEVANRFHFHVKQAGIELSESEFLCIKKNDRSHGATFLPIDIYLDNLRSAHNVGSIIRTVEAFRLGEVYCGGSTPFHKKVEKTSMQAHLDVIIHKNQDLDNLTKRPIIAIETAVGAHKISQFKFPKTFSLILGNEELGVSKKALDTADFVVEIPLFGKKNSINVATAFAIVANQIRFLHPI